MRKISLLIVAAAGVLCLAPHLASAQSNDQSSYQDSSDQDDGSYADDGYDDSDDDARQPHNRPPVGADTGYDYVSREYYRYEGPPPQAPAAREQRGYRDGQVEREPRTSYYSGVRLVYPARGRRHGCGCWSGHSRYGRDDDGVDYRNAYPYTYSYGTRRYTDQHLGRRGWGW